VSDLSMISLDVDRDGGGISITCEQCPWDPRAETLSDLSVPAIVAAAEAHVRDAHVTVIDGNAD
jgi:hypothetical protein